MPKKKSPVGVKTYLILSAIAGALVGAIVWGGLRDVSKTLIWAGLTFIISLVSIATLALTVKDEEPDPNKPKLK